MVTVTGATGVSLLQVVAATGCGLVAGLLFVFSAGVLTALGRLPADDGAVAMRAVNAAVLNPLFLGVFVGTAVVCAVLVVAVAVGGGPVTAAVAGVLYLVGVLGVTVAVNVPLNEALAAGRVGWADYRRRWGRWNHLRTTAATVALVLLGAA
jgi:uncharacterized membrane protein